MSNMKKSFESYLNNFYSKKGQGFTHTRIGDNNLSIKGGVYTIENIPDFYDKYIKLSQKFTYWVKTRQILKKWFLHHTFLLILGLKLILVVVNFVN